MARAEARDKVKSEPSQRIEKRDLEDSTAHGEMSNYDNKQFQE